MKGIIRFQVQFGIYLLEGIFPKAAEIARAASASAISSANEFQIEREKPYEGVVTKTRNDLK